jgi:YD repeat-containing protein
VCFLALLASLIVVAAGSGVDVSQADEGQEAPPAVMPEPMVSGIQAGYEDYVEEEEAREAELESPANVELREESRHAYEGLTPAELQELIRSTFGDVLENLDGDPARFLSDATVLDVAEPDAATVRSEGDSTLFEAGVPIRAENEDGELRKVDVTLVQSEGDWIPENPLVDLEVGSSANEGLELGDEGVGITQVGAEDANATRLGDKNLLFTDVSEGAHTDLLVSPISRGVELFDVLRSVDSPETLRFKFDLPAGSELRSIAGGGAEVIDAQGEPSLLIPAPWARDAQGSDVPVAMTVEDSQLVLAVEHKDGDFAYPILVDPTIYQDWGWWFEQKNMSGIGAFTPQLSANNWWTQIGTKNGNWPLWDGLAVATVEGTHGSGTGGYYILAPNANSYIAAATINPFSRNNGSGNCHPNEYPHPYDYAGTWNGTSWNMQYETAQKTGSNFIDAWGTQLSFGLGTAGGYIPCWRHVMAGGIGIWLDDWQHPYLDYVGPTPEGWLKKDATVRTFNVTASDAGLGVRTVRMFGVGTQEWLWSKGVCAGTYGARCKTYESGQISFTTDGFPYEGRYNGEGVERKFTVQVVDPTGKTWQLQRPLWLDGTAPSVSLSGQLATITAQTGTTEKPQNEPSDKDELSLPSYKLQITADDGASRSGVQEIKVYLDKDPSKEPGAVPIATKSAGSCPTAGCERTLTMDYTLRLPGLAEGKHSLFIVAVDKAGNVSPLERNIEFEYMPATGMKEEFVLQHFRLPDGNDYSGEAEYRGPEIAVNVMNGNVAFHERDADVDTERASLELERVYNSQQPIEKDTQWGRGWSLAQTPEMEPLAGVSPPEKATVTDEGKITKSVPIPQSPSQTTFSSRLRASITKTVSGYKVEPTDAIEASEFNNSGRIEKVVLGDDAPVYLAPEEGEPIPLEPTYGSSFGSYGTGNGQFDHPAGLDMAPDGTLWVADSVNDRVLHFEADGDYLGKIGSPGEANGQLDKPVDVEVDSAGNIWVADANNDRLQKFSPAGTYLQTIGAYGNNDGKFIRPEGIALDSAGNIWVADTGNNRIQKFTAAGVFQKKIGSAGSGEGQLLEPMGIDVGPGGNVFVADWDNNRVAVFSEAGAFMRQFGIEGYGDGEFRGPVAIEVDADGYVWVSDERNERIEQFDQSGEYITQFGEEGSGDGKMELANPMGIVTDDAGNVFFSDSGNDRVQRWRIEGEWMPPPLHTATFGSYGTGNGQFNHPGGLDIAPDGTFWIADSGNDRVLHFDADGSYLGKLGSPGEADGQLDKPSDVEVDSVGNIYVADANNDRVQKFSASGGYLSKFGSFGSGNGQFKTPQGLAIGADGSIWVADSGNNRIQKFNSSGVFLKAVGTAGSGQGQIYEPMGIDVGPGGNVFVADWDNNRVVVYNGEGSFVRQFGFEGYDEGQFRGPVAIEIDSDGYVWISDERNERIEQFNQEGDFLTQFGEEGTGDGEMELANPMGIVTDEAGNIFVTDSGNDRVQRWTKWGRGGGLAPYFSPPVIDYDYSEGKLVNLQLEDEATPSTDPELDMDLSAGLVAEVESEEAGSTSFGYEAGRLKAVGGTDGETKYGYDEAGRLNSVTLPNGTVATITYDSTSRATSVKVDPAGPEAAKTTNFAYSAEPRWTKVWGGGNPEITYDIADDGSVFKWAWAETPPTIASISGSLWSRKGQEIENKDHTLFVTGSSPHQVASVKVIVNGTSVMEEKTCEDPAVPQSHICDQPAPMEWITHPSEHAAGRMDIEVVVTDFLGHQTAERFFVIVPQQPPPGPETVERPNFKAIKLFREEYGLDRNKSLTEPQLNELILELLYEWEGRDPTAMRAVEGWGMPMRAPELGEMEWRKTYIGQASEAIPQWAEEHASSTYGGFYVDDRAGGKIYVGFTGSPQEQAATVEALKQSGVLLNPAQIYPYPTPPTRPVSNLESLQSSISTSIMGNGPAREATVSLSIPPEGNTVQIGATNPGLVEGFVKQQFGQSVPISVGYEDRRIPAVTRYESNGPIYGGSALVQNASSKQCTAGFGSRAPTGQQQGQTIYSYFILTAGHCFKLGAAVSRQTIRQFFEGPVIGKVRRRDFGSEFPGDPIRTDAEAVLVDKSLRSHSVLNGSPMRAEPIQGAQRPRVNRFVCWSGVTGGQHCGKVLRLDEGVVDGMLDFGFLVDGPAAQGDSGGPVWDPITHKAVGLIGSVPFSSRCWVLPARGNAIMCPRMIFTPLLPRPNQAHPEGAMPKLGVDILKED